MENCNIHLIVEELKSRGDSLAVTVRDLTGWLLFIGLLLSTCTWVLGWVENLVTGMLSVILISGFITALFSYPITQIIYRKEDRPIHEYAKARKELRKQAAPQN